MKAEETVVHKMFKSLQEMQFSPEAIKQTELVYRGSRLAHKIRRDFFHSSMNPFAWQKSEYDEAGQLLRTSWQTLADEPVSALVVSGLVEIPGMMVDSEEFLEDPILEARCIRNRPCTFFRQLLVKGRVDGIDQTNLFKAYKAGWCTVSEFETPSTHAAAVSAFDDLRSIYTAEKGKGLWYRNVDMKEWQRGHIVPWQSGQCVRVAHGDQLFEDPRLRPWADAMKKLGWQLMQVPAGTLNQAETASGVNWNLSLHGFIAAHDREPGNFLIEEAGGMVQRFRWDSQGPILVDLDTEAMCPKKYTTGNIAGHPEVVVLAGKLLLETCRVRSRAATG